MPHLRCFLHTRPRGGEEVKGLPSLGKTPILPFLLGVLHPPTHTWHLQEVRHTAPIIPSQICIGFTQCQAQGASPLLPPKFPRLSWRGLFQHPLSNTRPHHKFLFVSLACHRKPAGSDHLLTDPSVPIKQIGKISGQQRKKGWTLT